MKGNKEQTIGICFYDYLKKGSCPRSKQNKVCRFSHNCSQERRENPHVRESILRRMKAKNFDIPPRDEDPEHSRETNDVMGRSTKTQPIDKSRMSMPHAGAPLMSSAIQATPFYPRSSTNPPPAMLRQPPPPVRQDALPAPIRFTELSQLSAPQLKAPQVFPQSSEASSFPPQSNVVPNRNTCAGANDINNIVNDANFQTAIQSLIMKSIQQLLPYQIPPLVRQ